MAKGFDINARLQVTGPFNVRPVVQAIQAQLGNVSVQVNPTVNSGAASGLNNLQAAIAGISNQAAAANAAVRNLANTSKAIRLGGQLPTQLNQVNSGLGRANTAATRLNSTLAQSGSYAQHFGEQLGLVTRRFSFFLLAVRSIEGVTNAFGDGVRQAAAFQHEMVRLSQVGGTSRQAISAISEEIGRLATTLGVSSEKLASISTTLRQAGLSASDTKIALEALAKTAVAPTFENIENTVEGAIAAMQQFRLQARDLETVLGSINTVSAEYAVESQDIVAAIRKAGGAFKSASGEFSSPIDSLNQLIAVFTSVRQTTRESADEISTGLRTIFGRLQNNNVSSALREMGVDLRYSAEESKLLGREMTGQFVGAYEAIRRLSMAVKNLPTTDPRFAQIVEQVGGYRQISRVIPLLQQFNVTQQAYVKAQAGANSLTIDAARAQESYLIRLTKVKEEFLQLVRAIGDSSAFKGLFSTFETGARVAIDLAKALTPLAPLIAGFATKQIFAGAGRAAGSGFFRTATALPEVRTGRRRYATGGRVQGSGTGDVVSTMLPAGSFVVKRSSARKMGAGKLEGLKGVPVALEPQEYIYTPEEVRKIGLSNLRHVNKTGEVPASLLRRMGAGFAAGGQPDDIYKKKLKIRDLAGVLGLGTDQAIELFQVPYTTNAKGVSFKGQALGKTATKQQIDVALKMAAERGIQFGGLQTTSTGRKATKDNSSALSGLIGSQDRTIASIRDTYGKATTREELIAAKRLLFGVSKRKEAIDPKPIYDKNGVIVKLENDDTMGVVRQALKGEKLREALRAGRLLYDARLKEVTDTSGQPPLTQIADATTSTKLLGLRRTLGPDYARTIAARAKELKGAAKVTGRVAARNTFDTQQIDFASADETVLDSADELMAAKMERQRVAAADAQREIERARVLRDRDTAGTIYGVNASYSSVGKEAKFSRGLGGRTRARLTEDVIAQRDAEKRRAAADDVMKAMFGPIRPALLSPAPPRVRGRRPLPSTGQVYALGRPRDKAPAPLDISALKTLAYRGGTPDPPTPDWKKYQEETIRAAQRTTEGQPFSSAGARIDAQYYGLGGVYKNEELKRRRKAFVDYHTKMVRNDPMFAGAITQDFLGRQPQGYSSVDDIRARLAGSAGGTYTVGGPGGLSKALAFKAVGQQMGVNVAFSPNAFARGTPGYDPNDGKYGPPEPPRGAGGNGRGRPPKTATGGASDGDEKRDRKETVKVLKEVAKNTRQEPQTEKARFKKQSPDVPASIYLPGGTVPVSEKEYEEYLKSLDRRRERKPKKKTPQPREFWTEDGLSYLPGGTVPVSPQERKKYIADQAKKRGVSPAEIKRELAARANSLVRQAVVANESAAQAREMKAENDRRTGAPPRSYDPGVTPSQPPVSAVPRRAARLDTVAFDGLRGGYSGRRSKRPPKQKLIRDPGIFGSSVTPQEMVVAGIFPFGITSSIRDRSKPSDKELTESFFASIYGNAAGGPLPPLLTERTFRPTPTQNRIEPITDAATPLATGSATPGKYVRRTALSSNQKVVEPPRPTLETYQPKPTITRSQFDALKKGFETEFEQRFGTILDWGDSFSEYVDKQEAFVDQRMREHAESMAGPPVTRRVQPRQIPLFKQGTSIADIRRATFDQGGFASDPWPNQSGISSERRSQRVYVDGQGRRTVAYEYSPVEPYELAGGLPIERRKRSELRRKSSTQSGSALLNALAADDNLVQSPTFTSQGLFDILGRIRGDSRPPAGRRVPVSLSDLLAGYNGEISLLDANERLGNAPTDTAGSPQVIRRRTKTTSTIGYEAGVPMTEAERKFRDTFGVVESRYANDKRRRSSDDSPLQVIKSETPKTTVAEDRFRAMYGAVIDPPNPKRVAEAPGRRLIRKPLSRAERMQAREEKAVFDVRFGTVNQKTIEKNRQFASTYGIGELQSGVVEQFRDREKQLRRGVSAKKYAKDIILFREMTEPIKDNRQSVRRQAIDEGLGMLTRDDKAGVAARTQSEIAAYARRRPEYQGLLNSYLSNPFASLASGPIPAGEMTKQADAFAIRDIKKKLRSQVTSGGGVVGEFQGQQLPIPTSSTRSIFRKLMKSVGMEPSPLPTKAATYVRGNYGGYDYTGGGPNVGYLGDRDQRIRSRLEERLRRKTPGISEKEIQRRIERITSKVSPEALLRSLDMRDYGRTDNPSDPLTVPRTGIAQPTTRIYKEGDRFIREGSDRASAFADRRAADERARQNSRFSELRSQYFRDLKKKRPNLVGQRLEDAADALAIRDIRRSNPDQFPLNQNQSTSAPPPLRAKPGFVSRTFNRLNRPITNNRLVNGLSRRLSGFGGAAGSTGLIASAFVPDILERQYGTVANPTGSVSSARNASAIGQAVSTGGLGALAGSSFGVPGAVLGGVAGTIYGFVSTLRDADRQIAAIDFQKSFSRFQQAVDDIASGRTPFDGASSLGAVNAGISRSLSEADRRTADAGQGNFYDRWFRGSLTNPLMDGLFGSDSAAIAKEAADARQRNAAEILSPQVPALQQIGDIIAQKVKVNPSDLRVDATTPQAELDRRRRARLDAFGKAGGTKIAETISYVNNIPLEQVLAGFDRLIVSSNRLRLTQEAQVRSTSLASIQLQKFSRLRDAVEGAIRSVKGLEDAGDSLAAAFEGRSSTASPSGFADVNLGGINRGAIDRTLTFLKNSLPGAGGVEVGAFASTLSELDAIIRDLPEKIGGVAASGVGEDVLKQNIGSAFAGFSPDAIKRLQAAADAIDSKDLMRRVVENPEKLASDLVREAFGGLPDTLQEITRLVEERGRRLAEGLGQAADMRARIGESSDRTVAANANLFRVRTGQAPTLPLAIARQQRLAGNAAFQPLAIGNELRATLAASEAARDRINDPNTRAADRDAAQRTFVELTGKATDLRKALEDLADASNGLAEEFDRQQQSQIGLTEQLLTGDPSSLLRFQRGNFAAANAAQQGNFAGFNADAIRNALEFLRGVGDARFVDGPARGFSGNETANRLLLNSSPDVLRQFGIDSRATQANRETIAGQAAAAQEEVGKVQQGIYEKFLQNLDGINEKFLGRLDALLNAANRQDATDAIARQQVVVGKARAARDAASFIQGQFGADPRENGVERLRNLIRSPELGSIRNAQNEIAAIENARKAVYGRDSQPLRDFVRGRLATGSGIVSMFGQDFNTAGTFDTVQANAAAVNNAIPQIAQQTGMSQETVRTRIAAPFATAFQEQTTVPGTNIRRVADVGKILSDLIDKAQADASGEAVGRLNASANAAARDAYGRNDGFAESRVRFAAANTESLNAKLETLSGIDSLDQATQRLSAATKQLSTEVEKRAQYKASGGSIFKPRGTDTVPAMLSPNEFVVNARSATANAGLLEEINRAKGPVYRANGGFTVRQTRKQIRDAIAAQDIRDSLRTSKFNQDFEIALAQDDLNKAVGEGRRREVLRKNEGVAAFKQSQALQRIQRAYSDDFAFDPENLKAVDKIDELGARIANRTDAPPSRRITAKSQVESMRGLKAGSLGRRTLARINAAREERAARQARVSQRRARRGRAPYNPNVSAFDMYRNAMMWGFFAKGGPVRGTDSIPAMLSPGEYVVPAKAASANLPALQAMHQKPVYRANGGPVGNPQGGHSPAPSGVAPAALDFGPAARVLTATIAPMTDGFSRSAGVFNDATATFAPAANGLAERIGAFADAARLLAESLGRINIPTSIQLETNNRVEVLINGAQVIAAMKGDLAEEVTAQVTARLQSEVRRIINEMPAR